MTATSIGGAGATAKDMECGDSSPLFFHPKSRVPFLRRPRPTVSDIRVALPRMSIPDASPRGGMPLFG
jgi:hypothetical protein